MAYENQGTALVGITASGDLSANQFHFMDIDSAGQAAACGDGANAVGVLQNKPDAAGVAATIWGPGSISKVVAAETIAMGANVASDANAEAVAAATGDYVVGKCVAGGDAAELISIFIQSTGRSA